MRTSVLFLLVTLTANAAGIKTVHSVDSLYSDIFLFFDDLRGFVMEWRSSPIESIRGSTEKAAYVSLRNERGTRPAW